MQLTKEVKEQIIEDVKNRFKSTELTSDLNIVDIILDIFNNPESIVGKNGDRFLDIVLGLEIAILSAAGPINGLTAPLLIMVMEKISDTLRRQYPIESKFTSEFDSYIRRLEPLDFDEYTNSELDNFIIFEKIFKEVK